MLYKQILITALVSLSPVASHAVEHPTQQTDVAVVIADTFYQNPVNLAHAWRNHWHSTGQLLENAMAKQAAQPNWCKQQANAKLVLSLEPYLFYNPQLQTYYAEVIAKGYLSQDGQLPSLRPAFTLKEEATQIGSLNVSPDFFAQKAYEKATMQLFAALNNHQQYQTATASQETTNMDNLCFTLQQARPSKLYY